MTKQEKKEMVEEYERLFANPLNALSVYAPFCRFRDYFVTVVYDNLHQKVKHSLGKMMCEYIFKCNALLPVCQFGSRDEKLDATKQFLFNFGFLVSGIDFLAINNLGLSIKQATNLAFLAREIQTQMGGFKKYLQNPKGQNPLGEDLSDS